MVAKSQISLEGLTYKYYTFYKSIRQIL